MAEQTSTALGISNPYNAANLLAHGLKCAPRISMSQVPTTEQLRKEACDLCLNSTKGRGFTINTHHGVVFKIHSIMLIGGPQELEKVAFPVDNPGEKVVNLPEKFHPLFVNRLRKRQDQHAFPPHTSLPPNTGGNSFELAMNYAEFQVAMYGMAELLEYPALMSYAFGRLVQYFLQDRKDQQHVKQPIKIVFGPTDSPNRMSKDETGALKGLGIAAVLVHEKLHWTGSQMDTFRDLLADELDQGVWKEYRACYKQIKGSNQGALAGSTPTPGVASLTSAMGSVGLTPGSRRSNDVTDVLHSLFDEYGYWAFKALKTKTGLSGQVLNEALPKIAEVVGSGAHNGCWKRKVSFNRQAKWNSVDPNGGRLLGNDLPSVPTNEPIRTRSSAPQNPTTASPRNTPLSERKVAQLGRKFSKMVDADAHDTPGLQSSKYAAKSPKLDPRTASELFGLPAGMSSKGALTPEQMALLKDAGVVKKTASTPSQQTVAPPAMTSFAGIGGPARDFSVPVAAPAFSLERLKAFRTQGGDGEGNKKNVPLECSVRGPEDEVDGDVSMA